MRVRGKRWGLTLALALFSATSRGQGARDLPTPAGGHSLPVVVFLDGNGNGALDPGETIRLPGVVVEAGGARARTAIGTGRAVVEGLAAGSYEVAPRADSLPPFYEVEKPQPSSIPQASQVALPVCLPIGSNHPDVYMAFGDSITEGDGSSGQTGYRFRLETRLKEHFGAARLVNEGATATDSHRGARRIRAALVRHRPGFTLVLYGTNDWSGPGTERGVTIRSLGRILEAVREAQSLPVLATLPPTCVDHDERASPERDLWIARVNDDIRALAAKQRALLVDVHAVFMARSDIASFFSDGLHPNDAGYALIADAFFEALTRNGPL